MVIQILHYNVFLKSQKDKKPQKQKNPAMQGFLSKVRRSFAISTKSPGV